ncbi:MAG: hypothetical protein AB8G22_04345 [Saprospiraceae bacterium]
MKKTLFRLLTFLSITCILGTSPACNRAPAAVKYSKNYVDDLAKFAQQGGKSSKSWLKWFGRYSYNFTEVRAAKIAFNTRLPIYNSMGDEIAFAYQEVQAVGKQQSFQKDLYVIVEKTLQVLEQRNVYNKGLAKELEAIIKSSDDLLENTVVFNPATGALEITSTAHRTKVNYQTLLKDFSKLGVGVNGETLRYWSIDE